MTSGPALWKEDPPGVLSDTIGVSEEQQVPPPHEPNTGGEQPLPASEDDADDGAAERRVVAVVSLERTATQSVYHSLRSALDRKTVVMHSHFIGETPWRQVSNQTTSRKYMKEIVLMRRLQHHARRRIVFTILREAEERICSLVWYRFSELLRDPSHQYAQDPKIQTEICAAIDKQIKYHSLVYQRLGATGQVKKGRNDLPSGTTLYVLRFGNLAADFRSAVLDAFGSEIPLLQVNTAEQRSGSAEAYQAFVSRFNLKETLYAILRDRYGLGRETWLHDVEPGLFGLSDRWVSVMAAAVVREALRS